jgi:uncharacterized protein
MILKMREFEEFPAQVYLHADQGQLKVIYDCVNAVGNIDVQLSIQKSGDEFFCLGELETSVNLICSRCLSNFDAHMRNNLDFIVCSEETHLERQSEALDDEDYVFIQGAELQADISDIVRQSIILGVGLKPLCSENCQGLCPTCGANRNEQQCDCRPQTIDPRWEALQQLRNNL